MAGKVFRIGHLGWLNEVMVLASLSAAELALLDCGVQAGAWLRRRRRDRSISAARPQSADRRSRLNGARRMSHTINHLKKLRLQRSELAVPGSSPEMIDKAANSAADFIFLDIEDAVAPPDKERARKNIIQALNDIDWRAKGKTVSVRINGLDTHYMYRDVVDVMEQAGDRLDTILVPKVGVPADLYMVEAMVNQIEMAKGFKTRVGLEALIETALGMANVEAIAATPGRLEAMHFGVADYAASCKARTVNIGGLNPDYPGDQWHFALSRMTVACRAYGLRAIDGPFGDFSDPEGYIAGATPRRRARHRGQMGDPPLADRARQRRLLAAGKGGRRAPGASSKC